MSTKTIEMSVRQGNSTINIRETVDDGCTWMALAHIFHRFLLAQGYGVEGEEVGADVSDYVEACDIAEEEIW